ncbi:MAG: phosphoribosylformylglycinamidine synthase subunit PurS [Acidobacteria bacterium]|nr:phosphoribosylformylglycinamidine synthase subunit PurS [Acidobacteriota bacterium]
MREPDARRGAPAAVIHVTLKAGVLDPQGEAVCRALRNLGFAEVREVRVGKRIEVFLEGGATAPASERLDRMCRELLANPVIEQFRVEIPGAEE